MAFVCYSDSVGKSPQASDTPEKLSRGWLIFGRTGAGNGWPVSSQTSQIEAANYSQNRAIDRGVQQWATVP